MKKLIIAIILIVIIIVGFVGICKYKKEKYNYEIAKIEEYNYFIYNENEKYGVIDKNGKVIINADYTEIIIPNPEQDIFICYLDEKAEVLNSNREKKFTQFEQVEPIRLKNVASSLTYEKSVLSYKANNQYGLIDFKGNTITKAIYDSIENLQPTEGKLLVSKNNKYGVIDIKGNELVKTEYDDVFSDGFYTEQDFYKKSGFITSKTTNEGYRYGYIDYKSKKILDTEYNEITRVLTKDTDEIYLVVASEGKYGFYNKTRRIIKNEYQSIYYDENTDILIIEKNKKYGVANLNGKILVDVENDKITSRGKYIYAQKSNSNKVYNKQGKETEMNFNKSIYETDNKDYFISTTLNNDITYYGITDKNGKQLVSEDYRYIEYLYDNYFIATDDTGNLGIINSNGKTILDRKYSSLQKIKGTKVIQAIDSSTGKTEIYSENIEKIAELAKVNIQIQNDYIIISSDEEIIYLDYNGNKLENTENIKSIGFPDKVGEYIKQQVTIENVFYIKD